MKGQSLMSEADRKATWNTAITRVEPNRVGVRGYDIAELMGRVSFGAAVYLILTGELPSPAIARLMDAILVASIDQDRKSTRLNSRSPYDLVCRLLLEKKNYNII